MHAENGDVIEVTVKEALADGKIGAQISRAYASRATGNGSDRAGRSTWRRCSGSPLYVVHVSSAGAADAISDGRKRGLPIYGETCPQYLVCDTSDYDRPGFAGANYVMSPPLRDKWNQNVLIGKLKNGELQSIGSDHCSFMCGQKELGKDDFSKIPNGAPTIEDRVAIVYERIVNGGIVGLNQFVALTSTNPAKLFGLFPRKGTIAVGSDGDIVVWDPKATRTISATTHHMKADNSIFEGMSVRGTPRYVISRGRVLAKDGAYVGETGQRHPSEIGSFPPRPVVARNEATLSDIVTIGLIQAHHDTAGAGARRSAQARRDREARPPDPRGGANAARRSCACKSCSTARTSAPNRIRSGTRRPNSCPTVRRRA